MALADLDTYQTPPGRRPSVLARLSPWPALAFYPAVLRIVWRSGRLARRGAYGDAQWVAASLGIIGAMERAGMRLVVEGMEHLRGLGGPAVFVANHMSTLETFVLPAIIQPVRPITFVVKDTLLQYPVFGPVLRSRDPIPVARKNPREDLKAVFDGGAQRLARGVSVIVFPQGVRSPGFDPSQFNTLGVKLAARAGVAVVPLALRTDAWGSGRILKDFGRVDPSLPVRFRFGPALVPERKGAAVQDAVVGFIQEALVEWGSIPRL
ncbi:MAG: lysophospholipid acyltransferase family protein [Deferrisomatales bacterium]|nr:lysophospholipid acyltransferase family protein [Deferrisomatales bacterium]